MTRTEHLLTCLAEECAEVAHRVSKALRFGLEDIEPGQELNNAERISQEMDDLLAAFARLRLSGVLRSEDLQAQNRKMDKIETYLVYSKECGTLEVGV